MTKEDKQFFTGLIRGLERRLDGHDDRFKSVDERFEQVDKRFEQVDKRFKAVDRRFERLEKRVEENKEAIHYNGLLIEHMQTDIERLAEDQNSIFSIVTKLSAKVDTILEIVSTDIPVLKHMAKDHEKRIGRLEAKCL